MNRQSFTSNCYILHFLR